MDHIALGELGWPLLGCLCAHKDFRFWRPITPRKFYSLGDVAERSHLQNLSNEAIVVCEVGRRPGEEPILIGPRSFDLVWEYESSEQQFGAFDIVQYRFSSPETDSLDRKLLYLASYCPGRIRRVGRCGNNQEGTTREKHYSLR